MPWCPKCKLEYVAGKTICPDCNAELVDSLDDTVEQVPDELSYAAIMGKPLDELETDDSIDSIRLALAENMRQAVEAEKYQCIEDSYIENRSGAGVLIFCGLLGLTALLLNYLGVFNIPMRGFSLVLTYVVMGCLFFVFLISGIRSAIKAKTLKPLVEKEKNDIEKAVQFLKTSLDSYEYKNLKEEGSEVAYLNIYDKAAKDLKLFLTDAPEGFSSYVCDKYLGDLLDEN